VLEPVVPSPRYAAHDRDGPAALPECGPNWKPIYQRVMDSGEAVSELELDSESPADPSETRHWLLSFFPVRIHDELIGVGTVAIDVTADGTQSIGANPHGQPRTGLPPDAEMVVNKPPLRGSRRCSSFPRGMK
jgi:hypothetical protein